MSSSKRLAFTAQMLGILLAVTGCGINNNASNSEKKNGSVEVQVQGLRGTDVSYVEISVSGNGISPIIVQQLSGSLGQWSGTIANIPAGDNRTFSGRAYDSTGAIVYEGSSTGITIESDKTAMVVIVLQQTPAPANYSNAAPFISSLVASTSRPTPGSAVALSVMAVDADSDPLTYSWSASDGSFSNPSAAATTWTAPSSLGVQTITIAVSDGKGTPATIAFGVSVQSGNGSAQVDTSTNNWPQIKSLYASSGQVDLAETLSVYIDASDADSDTLSYVWSDNCSGKFPYGANFVGLNYWTAPTVNPSSGFCTLAITVSDGRGGLTTGTLTIKIGRLTVTPSSNYSSACEPRSGAITVQGLAGNLEGGVNWNTDLGAPEAAFTAHQIYWLTQIDAHAYYYLASRDYIDSNSDHGLHAVERTNGFSSFVTTLAQFGYSLNQLTVRFGVMTLGGDVEGQDWSYNSATHIETRQYRGGHVLLQLAGEDMVGGDMPAMTSYSDYKVLEDYYDDAISGQTVAFLPVDISQSSSTPVKALAQAFLDDVGAYGARFVFDSLQPIINEQINANGRVGGYYSTQSGYISIGSTKLYECP